jgi:predicted DNA-binding transcriptional regulator AlpA
MAIADTKAKPNESAKESAAVLLTAEQLSLLLNVPRSWIREKCRERARERDEDPLPVVRLGKYCRFRWTDIEEWLKRQSR